MKILKMAMQNSGKLHQDSLNLLQDCGIELNIGKKLKRTALNFPLEIFFLRDDDITKYLENGVADIGILGKNLFIEKEKNITMIEKLGFGKCRLSIAVPTDFEYKDISDLKAKQIATSYPRLLKKFLIKNKIHASLHEISGSVEIAPSIGLADCICDLVSSGETLFRNGLIEKRIILESEAVLAANKNIKTFLLKKLLFRIQAVQTAKKKKYLIFKIHKMQLKKLLSCIYGIKSTTILPLHTKNWSAVHAVINENEFWYIIEKIKENGAKDILVLPIEKVI